MGYRSDVRIKMGVKAYELLEKRCLEHKEQHVHEMVTDPDNFVRKEDYVIIGWNYVKWYTYCDDVVTVENTLKELNEIVEADESKLKDYFYKKIELGEDNATEEATNDYDWEYTDDFYVEVKFSL